MTHPLMVANKFPLPFSFFTLLVKYNYLRSRASPIRFAAMHHYFHDYKILSIEKIEFTFIHSSLLLYYNLRRKFQNARFRNSRRKGSNIPFNSFVKFFLFPARTNFPPKLSLSLPCARALVLVNYQRAGIAATSAYYLEADTGPEAPLSGPAFPSTRSGFINRADHDHDDIKLFCLSSENALSTGVLDTPFICCSASSYFYPPPIPLHSSSKLLPLLQHVPFSLCLLSSLLSEPILGCDFRRWQNAGTGKQPIGSREGYVDGRGGGDVTEWHEPSSSSQIRPSDRATRPGQIINPRVLTPFAS